MKPAARLRRGYFDCRYGQLHVHLAIPPGGGFDEATALLCLPGDRGVGRFFQSLLGPLGANRSIYAPDLPGHGESDSAGPEADAAQHALALADLLDSLRQRQVDVLTHAGGLNTALALVQLRPGALVRRLACSAPPPQALAEARRQGLVIREFGLGAATDGSGTAAVDALQTNDLINFFDGENLP